LEITIGTSLMGDLGKIFREALGLSASEPFDSVRHGGEHDGAEGVQWHLARSNESGEYRLAVNLEGLMYGGQRVIRKFLQRELARSRVMAVIRDLPAGDPEIIVHMARDAWINQRRRTPIKEGTIARFKSVELNETVWREMLTEALACLGPDNERGQQRVTKLDGTSVILPVVPHFNVGVRVPLEVMAIRQQVARLQPVHDAVRNRISSY
jgi:hypothetical protein